LPGIGLLETGEYEISYFVFYACSGTVASCERAADTIRVKINDQSEIVHAYDELKDNLPWIKKSTRFSTLTNSLNVLLNKLANFKILRKFNKK
jgi:putative IMPACT (imprinted ancient) family translation regulator